MGDECKLEGGRTTRQSRNSKEETYTKETVKNHKIH